MAAIYKIITAILLQVILASHLQCSQAAKILVYGAVGTHSTRISIFPLMEALAEKGHSVTFLSSYDNFEEDPNKKSKINYYTPEKWKQSLGAWEEHHSFFDMRRDGGIPDMWINFQDMGIQACQVLYSDPEFVNWVKTAKYDLVIMEYVVNECAYGLVHMFNAKLIVYGTSTVFPWVPDAYGLPDETSTLPDVLFDYSAGDMTFVQRVKNAISPIIFAVKRQYTYFPVLEEITRNGLGLKKDELPSFREIEQTASLILLTTHFTIDLPRSLPPHVIPVGGAVSGNKYKPLSKEMTEFINSSKSGFIYISFGTVTEFTNFDSQVQHEFIKALDSFPEINFLWKSTEEINATLPKNVMVAKWAPQQTVLGHPKIKAFITHCGMGSITEAIHSSVPSVLLPVLAEQDLNANLLEARGVGIKLEITTLKKHELEHAISEILNNSKYRIAMKKLSNAFKDRPSKPVENGVWWIEYVLRHENTNDYLVPLSVRQPWWKRRQIDVWLTVGGGLFLVLFISLRLIYMILKSILKRLCCSDNGKIKKSKSKQSKQKSN